VLSLETLFEHSLAAIDNQAKDIDKAQKAGLLELVNSSEQLSEISPSLLNDVPQFTVLAHLLK
jgi:hypothetical protein